MHGRKILGSVSKHSPSSGMHRKMPSPRSICGGGLCHRRGNRKRPSSPTLRPKRSCTSNGRAAFQTTVKFAIGQTKRRHRLLLREGNGRGCHNPFGEVPRPPFWPNSSGVKFQTFPAALSQDFPTIRPTAAEATEVRSPRRHSFATHPC